MNRAIHEGVKARIVGIGCLNGKRVLCVVASDAGKESMLTRLRDGFGKDIVEKWLALGLLKFDIVKSGQPAKQKGED